MIGQTRLAVIDLLTGDPPITTPGGEVGVAFNGEIYNYAALRSELLADGHRFRTSGDTEVIAHLAERNSPAAVARRLDGMFAVAISDTRTGVVALVRDRFGKKPLYWWRGADVIVFGSEIKAILAHPAVSARLDEDAIPAFLGLGYVPTPRTFYAGIESVPPGHVLTIGSGLNVELERYWSPRPAGTVVADLGFEEAAGAVRAALDAAVERRLVSDVPLGAYLSGGLDSTAIVGLMAAKLAVPVQTFTIGFDAGSGYDERPWARQAANTFGTDHHEFVVAPHAAELVERLVWHHDQPFGDSSALPTYLLAELTKRHVTVALSGDGGDELFGGYERFVAAMAAARMPEAPRRAIAAAARPLARLAGPDAHRLVRRGHRFLTTIGAGMPDALREWTAYASDDLVNQLVGPSSDWSRADYRRRWNESAGLPTLDRILLLNVDTYLVDDLLPKADRMAMAHGLEVRSPLLDHHLAELAFQLAPSARIRGWSLKRVLKHAVADVVPKPIRNRPKRGFGVPLDAWFRGELAPMLHGVLGDPAARSRQHLRGDVVDQLIATHTTGRAAHGQTLWSLLTLELFLRTRGW